MGNADFWLGVLVATAFWCFVIGGLCAFVSHILGSLLHTANDRPRKLAGK